ncbi:MAG: metal-dependent hydrolase [Desulfobacteraceae bacterium]|jgi:hypothetical protein
MNPATHLLLGWSLASACNINRRERALVTIAGVIPDIDGAGIFIDFFTSGKYPSLYVKYHHVLGHNIGFCIFFCLLGFSLARRRITTILLVFLSFHIHLLGDLAGSMGPDGYQWPVPYLLPFSDAWQLVWPGQWELNAWPNFAITFVAGLIMFFIAWKRGISPLEIVSVKTNDAFVNTLRNRFGKPFGEKGKNL